MVSSTRNPLYLALEWATLDAISGGRTILGTGMGNPEEGVRREFEALGLDYKKRAAIFDEGLEAIRQLWTKGSVTLHGEHFTYDDVSFYSGTELGPLMPVQAPPPIWVVSNPRLKGDAPPDVDGAPHARRLPPHRHLGRRLDDVLPRAAPGGARRAARR